MAHKSPAGCETSEFKKVKKVSAQQNNGGLYLPPAGDSIHLKNN